MRVPRPAWLLAGLPALAAFACAGSGSPAATGDPAATSAEAQELRPADAEEPAAGPRPDPEVTLEELRAHVAFLADDALAGRDTGSPGELEAARYLAARLAAYGLEPGGDDGSFLRKVELERLTVAALPELVVRFADGEVLTLGYRTGFDVRLTVPSTEALRVVVVDVAEAPPLEPDRETAVVLVGSTGRARRWLEASGAPDGTGFGLVLRSGSAPRRSGRAPRLPSVLRRPDATRPSARWARVYEPVFGQMADGAEVTVELRAHVELEPVTAYNVVGVVAGVGTPERPELGREAVVVSAHYDHIGTAEPPPASEAGAADDAPGEGAAEDRIYNGADDNASGTAAVVELAGALAAGPPPARTLVFLLATAEEKGLLGTQAYLDRPTVPLERTVYNLNLEMIGRPDPLVGGAGTQWLVGWDYTNVGPAFAERELAIVPDPRPEQRFFQRSDNMAFVQRGIVGQSLSSYALHEDYHRTSDEADTLDYEHLTTCTREALRALRLIADGELDPAWAPNSRWRPR